MKKALIYARYSPRPQPGDSIEKQVEVCKAYCERKKYEVTGIFTDEGVSGSEPDRPGLWNAIAELDKNTVLVCRWRNRLARDIYLNEVIKKQVKKKKSKIEAAEESNDDSPQGELIRNIIAAFAEYERKVTGIRTKIAMRRYQKQGRIMSRRLPYGFKRDLSNPGRMIPDSKEQMVIEVVKGLREEGCSLRAIGEKLHQMKLEPRTRKKWDVTTIRNILEHANEEKKEIKNI